MPSGVLPPYNIPDLPSADEVLPYLRRMDAARWYSNFGPLVVELESRLGRHMESPASATENKPVALTTMASCYQALAIGLQVFRLPPAAKILMPAVTFPACPLAAYHSNAVAVLADIDPVSWTLTPDIARAIADKNEIHAVMPVALYGVPVPVRAWGDFARDTGIPVIIDAAAAFDVQAVPPNCLVAFSLHGTKPFGAGEGGLLVGRDPGQIDEARLLSNFGTVDRLTLRNGMNGKMSEYHAAVALSQLDRWPKVKQRRRAVFDMYQNAFSLFGTDIAFQQNIGDSLISSFMVDVQNGQAEEITEQLKRSGVSAHRTYLPPLYAHPNFAPLPVVDGQGNVCSSQELAQKKRHMPGAERMARTIVGLPFHAFLKEADVESVVGALDKALRPQEIAKRATV